MFCLHLLLGTYRALFTSSKEDLLPAQLLTRMILCWDFAIYFYYGEMNNKFFKVIWSDYIVKSACSNAAVLSEEN